MNKWLSLFLASGMPVLTMAQPSGEIPPPKEPILPRASRTAEWTIVCRYDREQAKEEMLNPKKKKEEPSRKEKLPVLLPKEIHVSKDGATYREVTVWSDGSQTEKWILDGLQVQNTPKGNIVRVMLPTTFYSADYSDYSRSDFEKFEWIGKENYIGPQKFNQVIAYGFEVEASRKRLTPREKANRSAGGDDSPPSAGRDANPARRYVAYLDVKTQMPLYLDDGEVIQTYSYSPVSQKALVPPPPFARAIQMWKKEIERKTRVPLPP